MARLGRTGKRRKTRLVRRKRGELFDYVPSPTTRSGTRRDLRGTDLQRRIRVAERDLREREREKVVAERMRALFIVWRRNGCELDGIQNRDVTYLDGGSWRY